jgi:hypothetical protein
MFVFIFPFYFYWNPGKGNSQSTHVHNTFSNCAREKNPHSGIKRCTHTFIFLFFVLFWRWPFRLGLFHRYRFYSSSVICCVYLLTSRSNTKCEMTTLPPTPAFLSLSALHRVSTNNQQQQQELISPSSCLILSAIGSRQCIVAPPNAPIHTDTSYYM